MTFTFPFSPPFFFPFFSPGNLQGFILVGKDFGKTLRIVGLEKKEEQVGSTYPTTISLEFSGQVYNGVLCCSPACLTETCSFWYGFKKLFPCAQVR